MYDSIYRKQIDYTVKIYLFTILNFYFCFLESHHQYELAIRLAGYQPTRGMFDEEYDDQAECVLQLLHEPIWIDREAKTILNSNLLYQQLNATIIDIFNERLLERYRRREIVKDYGLVAFNKHQLWIKSIEV